MTIEIPLPMPTWNRLLAMNKWQRMKLRHYIHHAVFMSITYGSDWPTVMEFQGRPYSTELWKLEFYQMIRPNTSRKSQIASLKEALKKQS